MKKNLSHLDIYRINVEQWTSPPGATYGAFLIPGPFHKELKVIVSSSELDPSYPWDHVSVSTNSRCPNWPEMDWIKGLFFDDHECAMQLHVPKSDHINFHPYCLHIWRPANEKIPMPPAILVGPPRQKCQSHTLAEKDGYIVCTTCGKTVGGRKD